MPNIPINSTGYIVLDRDHVYYNGTSIHVARLVALVMSANFF